MTAIPFLADCAIELDGMAGVGNEEEVVKIDHWSNLLWCLHIISFTISKYRYHFTHVLIISYIRNKRQINTQPKLIHSTPFYEIDKRSEGLEIGLVHIENVLESDVDVVDTADCIESTYHEMI